MRLPFAVCVALTGVLAFIPRSQPPAADGDPAVPIPFDEEPSPRMRSALWKSLDIELSRTSLSAAMARLAEQYGVSVVLDQTALANAMVDRDQPVELRIRGVRLTTALHLILEPLNLVADVGPDFIRVVDQESTRRGSVVRVHPVADLVLGLNGGWVDPEASLIVRVITDTVDRDIWEPNGGDATAQFYRPAIAVLINAPRETHDKVHRTLAVLRSSRAQTARLMERHDLGAIEEALADADRVNVPPLGFFRPPQYPPAEDVITAIANLSEARQHAAEALQLARRLEAELKALPGHWGPPARKTAKPVQ